MIVVDNASQDITAFHRAFFMGMLNWYWVALLDALVWTRLIVVFNVFPHHTPQVTLARYQQLIQTFLAGRADPSFGERICTRCSVWGSYDFDVFGLEHGVEGR